MASLILFGGIGVTRLGVSKMPDVDFPQVTVSITYEGAAPEVVEAERAKHERLAAQLAGIDGQIDELG